MDSGEMSEKAPSYHSYPSPGFADEKNAYYSMYLPTEIPEPYESEYAIPQTNEKYAPRYGYSHPRLIDPYSEKPTPGLPPHWEASNTVSAGQGPDIPEDGAGDNSQGGLKDYIKLWCYAEPIDQFLHFIGFTSAIGAGAALPLMSLVFGELVNIFNKWGRSDPLTGKPLVTPDEFRASINHNALWFVYIFLGKFIMVYLHTTCFTVSATRMTRSIRLAVVKSILRQEIAYFDTCSPGIVATKISTHANLIQTGLSEKVGITVQGIAMLFSAFAVAFSKGWKLTVVTATTLPAVIIVVGITVAFDQQLEQQILEVYSKAGGLAEEALGSVRNIAAFSAEKKLKTKYDAYLEQAKEFGMKKGPVLGVQYSSQFSILYCAYALCFWYGIHLYLQGQISNAGSIVTILFSCIIATSSLTVIAPSMGDLTKAAAAAKEVHELISRASTIDSSSHSGAQLFGVRGEIELRNVSFKYPERPTVRVLDGVSMVFEAGKTTALVGASGSGKSTIVGLAERWYDPEHGELLLDGYNVKDLNLKWLRSQIGLVQQEPVLFNDTVYANVAHGLQGTDFKYLGEDEKRRLVIAACIDANAHEFIQDLPNGYDTIVGERASLMSGGQKQRIAIARSIISNPPILLLDEATSALDPRSEAVVQAALEKASKTRTTIMIAHRLSTVKKADKIVVMNKGQIVEQGTHDELMFSQGAYYLLVSAQQLAVGPDMSNDNDENAETECEPEQTARAVSRKSKFASRRWSTWTIKPEIKAEDGSGKYNILRCLGIIFYEHKQHWLWFLGGLTGCFIAGAIFPAQAILFSKIVTVFSHYFSEKLRERGNFWALMFFILAIGTLIGYALLAYCWTSVAFLMARVYRSEYFSAIIRQDIEFFDIPENSSGSLTARLSSDPQSLQDLMQGNLGLIIVVLVNILSSSLLSLFTGWKLSLVAIFGCLPPLFLAGFTRMRLELSSQERVSKFFHESTRFAAEAVSAIRTVASLTLEDEVIHRYAERLNGPVRSAYRRTLWLMILFGLSESVDLLGIGLAFWYGGRLMSFGEYDAEQFFLVFIAVVFGGQAAGMLFGFTANLTKAHAAANKIIHLRSVQPTINFSTGCDVPYAPYGCPIIEFKNVRFAYPTRPSASVLRHCSFQVYRGQKIGLVGSSGCGKSTIISLLERFYDITSGDILINGVSISALDVQKYRSTVALVSQEPTLYQGSIRENITLGIPYGEVSDEAVEKAARDANIHTFIQSLPQGYDTDVGTKGTALSGGQRQRLAIARALIRDPSILLLDEATSALDTESERIVQDAIEVASRGRTVLAVAHRLSTIRGYDRILVFESGRVAEEGSHEELVALRGRYWNMCLGQGMDREAA